MPGAQGGPHQCAGESAQRTAGQPQAEQGAAPLGNHRGPGRAGHAPVQAEDEPQVQGDIDQIGGEQNRQRRACVLCAQKPAHQCVAGQGGGQAEQPDVEELQGQGMQFGGRLHQAQGHAAERNRDGPQQH